MFVCIKCENIPEHLRGYISRYCVEVDPNLFVGQLSRKVFDKLVERVKKAKNVGRAVIINSTNNEQGYTVTCLNSLYKAVDLDGFTLISRTKPQ